MGMPQLWQNLFISSAPHGRVELGSPHAGPFLMHHLRRTTSAPTWAGAMPTVNQRATRRPVWTLTLNLTRENEVVDLGRQGRAG